MNEVPLLVGAVTGMRFASASREPVNLAAPFCLWWRFLCADGPFLLGSGTITASTGNDEMPVVRISKGKFKLADAAAAERLLAESERALREPLSRLSGLLHYYVGIDRVAGYLTNVSVWESIEAAHQMDTLQAMLAQRPLLERAGVTFEVITNHDTLWTITP